MLMLFELYAELLDRSQPRRAAAKPHAPGGGVKARRDRPRPFLSSGQ